MPKIEKSGKIKSLIFASSTGEKKAISAKIFLKGDFNAWNVTKRIVVSESDDKKEYSEAKKFLDGLLKQAGVDTVNALDGKSVMATFDGEDLVTFRMN